jgi:hypothetical protein
VHISVNVINNLKRENPCFGMIFECAIRSGNCIFLAHKRVVIQIEQDAPPGTFGKSVARLRRPYRFFSTQDSHAIIVSVR